MTKTAQPRSRKAGRSTDSIDSLYFKLVNLMYDEENLDGARKVGDRLEKLLAKTPESAETIRAIEIQSLISELRGNLVQAARFREAEIRKILELHSLAVNTPQWPYVARQYDFSDVSDRLELLAILYDQMSDTPRAISTLIESQHYCEAHNIPFDGQPLLDELRQNKNATSRA